MGEKASFVESIQEKMMIFTSKMQANIYIQSLSQGMMGTMGVLIAGSICNLLVNMPIPGWLNVIQALGIYDLLTVVVKIFQLTGPLSAFLIGFALAKYKDVNQVQAGILCFMSYLLCVPVITGEVEAVAFTAINSENIATAMIVGMVATSIFAWITKKGVVLKMPDVIPEFVSSSLGSIPACVLSVLPFIILRGVLSNTSFGSFPGLVSALISSPLSHLGNNIFGHMVFTLLSSLCWWLGIHNSPVMTAAMIVVMPATTENIMAVMSGLEAPHLLSLYSLLIPAQLIGGPGAMLGLYVNALRCKSERYKAQAKIQLIPGLFNIIEPAIFGFPVMMNFTFLIPMLLTPQVILIVLYFCLEAGLFTTPVTILSAFLPAPICGFLMGSTFGLGIFMIIASVFSVIAWYPFVKLADKRQLQEEAALQADNE